MSSSFMPNPCVKDRDWPCLNRNLRICNSSISSPLILLRLFVAVIFPDEKTCSQETAEPWMAGYQLQCCKWWEIWPLQPNIKREKIIKNRRKSGENCNASFNKSVLTCQYTRASIPRSVGSAIYENHSCSTVCAAGAFPLFLNKILWALCCLVSGFGTDEGAVAEAICNLYLCI